MSESQAGFRFDHSCVDNIFTLNEVIQGRLQEGKKTFSFFLDIKKAYDTVWRDGLWYKLWEMGIQGKLWQVIRNIYNINSSCVFLNGCKSDYFDICWESVSTINYKMFAEKIPRMTPGIMACELTARYSNFNLLLHCLNRNCIYLSCKRSGTF